MSAQPRVVVHGTAELLAQAAAARLVTRLVDAQSSRGRSHVVLTGGGTGTSVLAALAASPARDAIDWRSLHVWWGDERFLATGDPERNETQARSALLDAVPLESAHVHPMPALDGPDGDDVDAAARRYAADLATATRSEDHGDVPQFDVVLLGVGPDGHIASLFPEHPGLHDQTATVIGVRNSPKPPPTRISLTFRAIQTAQEVWCLVAGADKAGAVAMALSGAGQLQVPAAGARGRRGTLWMVDRAAGAQVPRALVRLSSP